MTFRLITWWICLGVAGVSVGVANELKAERTPPADESTSDFERELREHDNRVNAANAFNQARQEQVASQHASTPPAPVVRKPKAPSRQPVSPGAPNPHEYSGFVGDAAIDLSMTVYNGNVDGQFHFLRAPNKVYTIKGKNEREGLLRFVVESKGVPFGKGKLTKDPTEKNAILWDGKLETADNQSLRFFLNRSLKPATDSNWPTNFDEFNALKGYERYAGTLTDSKGYKTEAVFKLRFAGIKCDGFYYQIRPNRQISFIFRLEGQNPQGLLTLREFDDEGMSAELYLRKKPITNNVVSWTGQMTNLRFNQQVKTVEFQRSLAAH
jgi:hypothetical protein